LRFIGSLLLLFSAVGAGQDGAVDDIAVDSSSLLFEGYESAPEIAVVPRKDDLFFYPCTQCHAFLEPSSDIRELGAPHSIDFEHGRGRIWCMSCHDLENRDSLVSLLGEPVDFDAAHLVCGGCHGNRHKDWYFGAHGKRIVNWQGERTVFNCTHCHDAHSPAIKPRAPKPSPPVRAGLEREVGVEHAPSPLWESLEERDEQ
jgi:hypothetical protein